MCDITGKFDWARPIRTGDIPCDIPLVLLDVDGCVNIWDRHMEDGMDVDGDPIRVEELSFPDDAVGVRGDSMGILCPKSINVAWHPWLAEAIASATDAHVASFAWLTSWNMFSWFLEGLLWPDMPSPMLGYIPWRLRGFSDRGIYGKADAIGELFGNPQPYSHRRAGIGIDARSDGCDRFGRPQGVESAEVPRVAIIDDNAMGFGHNEPSIMGEHVGGIVPLMEIAPERDHGVTRGEWDALMGFLGGADGSPSDGEGTRGDCRRVTVTMPI